MFLPRHVHIDRNVERQTGRGIPEAGETGHILFRLPTCYGRAVEFRILYCNPCGYRERAEELAAELRERFGARVIVEEGGFGQFDVLLDGALVASKGGFWKRILIHGAPPRPRILEAIDRALADREGDSCEIPEARQDGTRRPA